MTNPTVLLPHVRGRRRISGPITGLSPLSPIDLLMYDSFTGTNGDALAAHSPDIGAYTWEAWGGSMTIQSNTAQCQGATTIYAANLGRPDVTITCQIKAGAGGANNAAIIVCRGINLNNFLIIYFSGDGAFSIQKRSGGSYSTINAGGSWPYDTNFHTAKVVCEDTRIEVYCDDVLKWEGDVPTFASGTYFGLMGFVSGANKDSFDDFRVYGKRRVNAFPGEFIANSFTDPFTGADTTRLNTFGWTEDAGTWQISGNKATQTGAAAPTNGYVVSRDVGLVDVALEVKITTPAASGFICGLVFRMVDANHYVEAELNTHATQGGFALWYTNNSGAYIEIARHDKVVFTPANNTTYTMRIRAKGQLIIAELVESNLKLVGYCRQFMKATKVGLFEFRSGSYPNANLYDDFKVYNL